MDLPENSPSIGGTRDLSGEHLTGEVLASFDGTQTERFREIMRSLVWHLHAFAREVSLTEEEWAAGIDFLTRTGQACTGKRQEFILLSDTLGLSMQVIGINHPATGGSTESTVFGPFFVADSPAYKNGDDLANGAPGEPCFVSGQVRSTTGEPLAGAHLEVWQADDEGLYDVQRAGLAVAQNRGQLDADERGRFWFWSVKPVPYPIPYDGPVGDMLKAAGRSPMRPAHIHFRVAAPGYTPVTTHVFVAGDPYLDSDAVFGVKESLIAPFERHEPGTAPDGTVLSRPFHTAHFDFALAPAAPAPWP
jgi:hydroxyquinol 1,2-dioxygenase